MTQLLSQTWVEQPCRPVQSAWEMQAKKDTCFLSRGHLPPHPPFQASEDRPGSQAKRVLNGFSRALVFATPWPVARQVPLSMGFSRQEHWSGSPCSPIGELPNPGITPKSYISYTGIRFFTISTTWPTVTPRVQGWPCPAVASEVSWPSGTQEAPGLGSS